MKWREGEREKEKERKSVSMIVSSMLLSPRGVAPPPLTSDVASALLCDRDTTSRSRSGVCRERCLRPPHDENPADEVSATASFGT
jgi:hypothetical protein